MIARDIQQRLTVTLGPQIPVLMPEEIRTPLEAAPLDAQGRPVIGQGQRGIGAYLAQHPSGYVQIEPLTPLPSGMDGIQQRIWATISINAASSDDCQALYDAVHLILCGIPGREPGDYTEKQAGVTAFLTLGYWQARLIITRPVIGGRI